MPKLSYVGVERLLGRFKHEVNFDTDWEFVILHGPNGVGKTRLLELIHSVLSGQLERLKRIPFDSAELRYDDGSSIAVGHRGQERLPVGDIEDAKQTTIEVRLTRPGQAPVAFEVEPMGDIPPGRMAALERELNTQRVGPDEWMDMSFGDRVTTHGLIERYADEFPRGFFGRPSEQPSEFRDFIAETPVHLIETQRLLTARPWRTRRGVAAEHVPITVMRHARELTERLSRALANNSTISQRLDRTFPGRVIVDAPAPNVTEEQIRQRYSEQGLLRDRLETVSLLDEAASDVRLPERDLKDWERGVLWTYLEDAEEKLSTFLPLLERVQLLREIVNARFLFKELGEIGVTPSTLNPARILGIEDSAGGRIASIPHRPANPTPKSANSGVLARDEGNPEARKQRTGIMRRWRRQSSTSRDAGCSDGSATQPRTPWGDFR